ATADSSSFMFLDALLKSVPSTTRYFSNPALVPARLTSTETFSCSLVIYSSASFDIKGKTVPEPSITTLPSILLDDVLASFSVSDPHAATIHTNETMVMKSKYFFNFTQISSPLFL